MSISDIEREEAVAYRNAREKRSPLRGHPARINGAAPIPLDDFRPERAKDESHKDKSGALPWIDMSNWDNEPTPEREWTVRDRIPARQVTLLSGEGAVGKSIVELNLCVAHPLAKDWLGTMPEPGGAFYIGAEDDEKELHIRLSPILAHYGATYSDLIRGGFRMVSLCGDDAVLGAPNRHGIIEPTKLYQQIYEQAAARFV
jgi:RecA-family ATPase